MRGASNRNARGSSYSRLRRKLYLFKVWAANILGYVRCYRCGTLLTLDDVTVDRIVPGCKGGRYVRGNIRPACAPCNSETGGGLRR